jgi:hypothetical protein
MGLCVAEEQNVRQNDARDGGDHHERSDHPPHQHRSGSERAPEGGDLAWTIDGKRGSIRTVLS